MVAITVRNAHGNKKLSSAGNNFNPWYFIGLDIFEFCGSNSCQLAEYFK